MPTGHDAHVVLAYLLENVPKLHGVHRELPDCAKSPGGQALHVSIGLTPVTANPEEHEHTVLEDAPVTLDVDPLRHGVHGPDMPGMSAYVFIGQSKHPCV